MYIVLLIANEKPEYGRKEHYPIMVVYGDNKGSVWSIPLTEWHISMTYIGDNG